MQLTIHGSRYGLLLDDGVELVGDGEGMTLAECEMWAEAIEQRNMALASRMDVTAANPSVKECLGGWGSPLACLGFAGRHPGHSEQSVVVAGCRDRAGINPGPMLFGNTPSS